MKKSVEEIITHIGSTIISQVLTQTDFKIEAEIYSKLRAQIDFQVQEQIRSNVSDKINQFNKYHNEQIHRRNTTSNIF